MHNINGQVKKKKEILQYRRALINAAELFS